MLVIKLIEKMLPNRFQLGICKGCKYQARWDAGWAEFERGDERNEYCPDCTGKMLSALPRFTN